MISSLSPSMSKKHFRKTTNNGRKFSIDVDAGMDNGFVSFATKTPANDRLRDLVASSWQGMRSGHSPTLCEVGVGGTYFMKDSFNRKIGVFKPYDEEMGCLNNPKGFTPLRNDWLDRSSSLGVVGGEAAFRECAAYVLDHEHFSGVPATDLVACSYPTLDSATKSIVEEDIKIGSFQEFKEHDFDAEDISPAKAARFPVNEVQKIAILDIRMFNTDRHGGNILVRKVYSPPSKYRYADYISSPTHREYNSDADENGAYNEMQFYMDTESDEEDLSMSSLRSSASSSCDDDDLFSFELIPIDHGYTLPTTVSGLTDSWFEWLNWPQAKQPFTHEALDYIDHLDAEHDVALLRQKFGEWIQPECYKVLRITTMWLKLGAQYNLTPYDLGVRMCCQRIDVPSELEKMCWEAEEFAHTEASNDDTKDAEALFMAKLADVMIAKLKEIVLMGASPASKSKKLAEYADD